MTAPEPSARISALARSVPGNRSALIVSDPTGEARLELLTEPPSLAQLQAAVQGFVEPVPTHPGHHAYCNDEGRVRGLPVNRGASNYLALSFPLVGSVAILIGVGIDADGEFVLTPAGGAR